MKGGMEKEEERGTKRRKRKEEEGKGKGRKRKEEEGEGEYLSKHLPCWGKESSDMLLVVRFFPSS
jgi:hypothetical protein